MAKNVETLQVCAWKSFVNARERGDAALKRALGQRAAKGYLTARDKNECRTGNYQSRQQIEHLKGLIHRKMCGSVSPRLIRVLEL